jgi:S1-C subfamily serine protease
MWVTIRSGASGGQTIEVSEGRVVLGREEGCDVVLDDEKVSRQHASLFVDEHGRTVLEDLGSTNGTFVDGNRVESPVVLRGGEEVRLGDTLLALSARPPSPPTATENAAAAAPGGREAPAVEPAGPDRDLEPVPSEAVPTPSKVERLALKKSVRRAQIVAAIAGAGVAVAIVVIVLFVTGVIGGGEEDTSIPEIIETAKPATAQIRGVENGESFGLGSGWVLDAEEGLIVTNAHVTNEATDFAVRIGDERKERAAEVVGVAPCEDLAVLRVSDSEGLVTMPLGSQGEVRQGDSVVALGYPASLSADDELIATEGVVSVVRTRATLGDGQRYENALQADAVINPGNSGGPLVNENNELVGVNTFKTVAEGIEGQFYAIGVDRVKPVVDQLRRGNSIGWNGMGLFYPQQEADLAERGLPVVPGLVVDRAVPGTPAAEAGFGQGPVLIVAIDGTPVDTTIGSWCSAVGDLQAGESATFTVVVPGATQTQDVEVSFG